MLFVARFYASEEQAQAAVDAALEVGFDRRSIVMLAPSRETYDAEGRSVAVPSSASVADAVRAGEWMGMHTQFYTSRLGQGNTLIVINPPLYWSRQAEQILDAHNPLDISHESKPDAFVPFEERDWLFSDVLGLGTLSEGTFSESLGFATKQDGMSHFSRFMSPLASNFTFSSKFGMGFSTSEATPLSSLLGFSTKSTRLEGKSSSFGISVKTAAATPLSSMFGMPTLTKKRLFLTEDENASKAAPQPYVPYSEQVAPFSQMLGLKVLANGTFSGAFGIGTRAARLSLVSRVLSPLASDFLFSSKLGLGFATSGATPLSSLIGFSTKSGRMDGKGSSFGMSTSTTGGTPFSSTLGLPLLSKKQFYLS